MASIDARVVFAGMLRSFFDPAFAVNGAGVSILSEISSFGLPQRNPGR